MILIQGVNLYHCLLTIYVFKIFSQLFQNNSKGNERPLDIVPELKKLLM